jgi:phosphoribosylamine--glycine ligase
VIEYNCRFGDPETQPIMVRLKSDLVALCNSALDGDLDGATAAWDTRCAIGVVLAAAGYPGGYDKGLPISGLDREHPDYIKVFHAGTRVDDGQVVTNGGRVLCVTALGEDIADAQRNCYAAADTIHWDGVTLRRDIGWRALARYSQDG